MYRELRHTICRHFNNAATLHVPAQHRACELRRRTITLKKLQANTPSKLLHKASQVPKHMVAELSTLNIAMHTQQAEQKSTSLHTQAQTLDTTTHAASALPIAHLNTQGSATAMRVHHDGRQSTSCRTHHNHQCPKQKNTHTRPPGPRQTYIPWKHTTQNQSGVTGSQVWLHGTTREKKGHDPGRLDRRGSL